MNQNFDSIFQTLDDPRQAVYIRQDGSLADCGDSGIMGIIPPLSVSGFGSPDFKAAYDLRYAYVGGAMVGGISSKDMVCAFAKGGALGIFGSTGLAPALVEDAVVALKRELKDKSFGACLIHTPHDPTWEESVLEIYLKHQVRLVEASAFMQLTPSLVRYRLTGARRLPDGTIEIPNRIMAKVSRVELARRFFSPPPPKLVKSALDKGWITADEAALAPEIPMAGDLTAEADSGGHTDFRPALPLWTAMVNEAQLYTNKFNYPTPLRVGAAGGIGTPWSVLAAAEIGVAYVLTGSVNQSCLESGLAPAGRELLGKAGQTDVVAAPAADMFEMGARVQVLKFGTLYAMRSQKLSETYRQYGSLEEIPATEKEFFETKVFRQSLEDTWTQTRKFFLSCDPSQVNRAEADPKYKMALVFRWYLGQSTRWAIAGLEERRPDWQINCGPAQGAFNEWAKGSYLEAVENRKVMDVAVNLLYGATVIRRRNLAVLMGVLPFGVFSEIRPRPLNELAVYLD